MADNELLIKINGDAANAVKAFDDVYKKTEDLQDVLNKVGLTSAGIFAALTAEIGLSAKAFAESDAASRSLGQALQVQGIAAQQVTVNTENGTTQVLGIADAYKQYAKEVENATGINGTSLIQAQAVLQEQLGQTKVTKELTQAVADLAAGQKIGLNEAATLIGKTIETNINAFRRQGLELSDTATKSERLAAVLEFVNGRYKDQAEIQNQGLGGLRGLATAFDNLQTKIGENFAPVLEVLIKNFTALFNFLADHQELVDFGTAVLVAGSVVSALGIALPIAAAGFTAITAAAAAAKIEITATQIAVKGLIGATGIGLLVIAVTEIALHWQTSFAVMKVVAKDFLGFITDSFSGLAKVLSGAFTLDAEKINEGLNQIKSAFTKVYTDIHDVVVTETKTAVIEQDEILEAAADKRAQKEAQRAAQRAALRKAETELLLLQVEHESQALIDLKQKEVETLKAIETNKNKEQIALLQVRLAEIQNLEAQQREQDVQRRDQFAADDAAVAGDLNKLKLDQNKLFRAKDIQDLQAQVQTETEVERKVATDKVASQIKTENQLKEDRIKYGTAIAVINSKVQSDEVKGATQAANDLVALQNSKNATLRTIGKAAAITSITISTAKAAIEIFEGFANIPIIGYALGLAGAAAAVAFGAEQIGSVVAAADGGVITGGVPGKDSVHLLAMPGELVVPTKNFDEVVGATRDARAGGSEEQVALLQSINDKLQQPTTNIIQGDVLADTAFIDILFEKMNARSRFGNGRLVANGT